MFVYPQLGSQCGIVYKQPKGKLKCTDVQQVMYLLGQARHYRLVIVLERLPYWYARCMGIYKFTVNKGFSTNVSWYQNALIGLAIKGLMV